MAILIVRRKKIFWRDRFGEYKVVLDGKNVGGVANGSEFSVSVSPGDHTVQLKVGWCTSNPLAISIEEGEKRILECGPNGAFLLVLLYTTIFCRRYIWLRNFPSAPIRGAGTTHVVMLLILIGLVYAASPWVALYRTLLAIQDKDEIRLDEAIDWDAIRADIKSELKSQATELAERIDKGNGLGETLKTAVAGFIAPIVIEKAVESQVNPARLIEAMDENRITFDPSPEWIFEHISDPFFSSVFSFHFDYVGRKGTHTHIVMTETGLDWHITKLAIPSNTLENVVRALAGANRPVGN